MVWTLTPWQTLLWIVTLEMITLPLLVGMFSSIFDAWFKAKERHASKIADALGKTISKIADEAKAKYDKLNKPED